MRDLTLNDLLWQKGQIGKEQEEDKEKCPSPGRNQTLGLTIMRQVVYLCATTTAIHFIIVELINLLLIEIEIDRVCQIQTISETDFCSCRWLGLDPYGATFTIIIKRLRFPLQAKGQALGVSGV